MNEPLAAAQFEFLCHNGHDQLGTRKATLYGRPVMVVVATTGTTVVNGDLCDQQVPVAVLVSQDMISDLVPTDVDTDISNDAQVATETNSIVIPVTTPLN